MKAELALVVLITASCAALGAALQRPTKVVLWDAVQYYSTADQLAVGARPHAEAPYVYRLAMPWLASKFSPVNPAAAFKWINIVSGFAIAVLLDVWLSHGISSAAIRIAMVTLFAAAWHGPVRYVFFNPGYVDPPFIALLLLCFLLIDRLETRWSVGVFWMLTLITVAGTFVRETMALVPLSLLFLGNPIRQAVTGRRVQVRTMAMALIPLAGVVGVIVSTHSVVDADVTRSFTKAALQWIHKPLTSYALGWFTAFGPVLAVALYDWRRGLHLLAEREWLGVYLAVIAVLAFMGGSDTERFVFWSIPVMYLLIGRALERHRFILRDVAIAGPLVVLQAISMRVFWGIPDPAADGAPLASAATWSAKAYDIVDRLVIIDNFHWNLWSSFGSRPFQLARLGLYVAVTAALVWAMHRRARLVGGLDAAIATA